MNARRKKERRKIQDDIRTAESHLRHNERSIQHIKANPSDDPEFVEKQLKKLAISVTDQERKISELHDRERALDMGLLDDELRIADAAVKNVLKEKSLDAQKKRDRERDEDQQNKNASQAYWDATVKADRRDRYSKRDADRAYNDLNKAVRSLPRYMQENLKKLPSNRGYIWRGVYNYGEQPPQKGKPTEMEEQVRGQDYDFVHEWTSRKGRGDNKLITYRRYEKRGRGRDSKRKLVHEETYQPIQWSTPNGVFWK